MTLTLMGDSPTIPWRLLGIDLLVEDKESGGMSVKRCLNMSHFSFMLISSILDCSRKGINTIIRYISITKFHPRKAK